MTTKRLLRVMCVLGLGLVASPQVSLATPVQWVGCLMPVAMASDVNPSFLWTSVAVSSCNSRLYVDPADKEIMAIALTAAINRRVVQVYYENAAPQVTYTEAGNFPTTCKVMRVNIDYYQSAQNGAPCTGYGY